MGIEYPRTLSQRDLRVSSIDENHSAAHDQHAKRVSLTNKQAQRLDPCRASLARIRSKPSAAGIGLAISYWSLDPPLANDRDGHLQQSAAM
jgi:hypothetical protein